MDNKYHQALQSLLPTGYAWPRDPNSVLMRLLGGLAGSFAELDALTSRACIDWQPSASMVRMSEWEAAVGLPDPCLGPGRPAEERRRLVLSRLRGAVGYFSDSSPASPWSIAQICQNLGYPAQVQYNSPFRCGRDRVSRRVGQLDGRLFVTLSVGEMLFRVASNRAGDRLLSRPPEAEALACYLQRYVPARFEVTVIFKED